MYEDEEAMFCFCFRLRLKLSRKVNQYFHCIQKSITCKQHLYSYLLATIPNLNCLVNYACLFRTSIVFDTKRSGRASRTNTSSSALRKSSSGTKCQPVKCANNPLTRSAGVANSSTTAPGHIKNWAGAKATNSNAVPSKSNIRTLLGDTWLPQGTYSKVK